MKAAEFIAKKLFYQDIALETTLLQYARLIADLGRIIQMRAKSVTTPDWNRVSNVCTSSLCTGTGCPSGYMEMIESLTAELVKSAQRLKYTNADIGGLVQGRSMQTLCHAVLSRGDGDVGLSLAHVEEILAIWKSVTGSFKVQRTI